MVGKSNIKYYSASYFETFLFLLISKFLFLQKAAAKIIKLLTLATFN